MSKINKNPDTFQLDQINVSNLTKITIEDVSEGESQGRRFTVSLDGKTSDKLIFNEIFKQVQHLAKKEGNIENLETINEFLKTFKTLDETAEDTYKLRAKKDLGYRINTWIHRAFKWGSHAQNIDNLTDKIEERLNGLQNDFNKLDHIHSGEDRDIRAEKLVNKLIEGTNLDLAMQTIPKIFDKDLKDSLLERIIIKYEPKRAIELAKNSEFKDPNIRESLLLELGKSCKKNGQLEFAYDAVGGLDSNDASALQRDIAQSYISRGDPGLEQSIKDICKADITNKESLLVDIAILHSMRNKPELTFELLRDIEIPSIPKDMLMIGIIRAFLEFKQNDEAMDVLQFISDETLKQKLESQIPQ